VTPPTIQPKPAESRWGMWAALIVLLVGIGGFGLFIATRHPTPPVDATVTASLTAEPSTVQKGQSVTLHWSSQNASDLDLEPAIGKVQSEGSTSVTPNESTTYTLTAIGANGTRTPSARVVVTSPPPPEPPQEKIVERHQEIFTGKPKPVHNTPINPPVQPPPQVIPVVNQPEVKGRLTMGKFLRGRGEYDEAIASFQEGLKLDPSNAELRQELDNTIKTCKRENTILNEGLKCGGN
jgi:hypothetical protein